VRWSYTPCPEKNGTNNVLGITLANTNIVVILAQNVVKVMQNQTNTTNAAPNQCHYFTLWIKRSSCIKMHNVITDNCKKIRLEHQRTTVQMSELKAVLEMTATPFTQTERRRRHWRTAEAMMAWSSLAHSVLMRCLSLWGRRDQWCVFCTPSHRTIANPIWLPHPWTQPTHHSKQHPDLISRFSTINWTNVYLLVKTAFWWRQTYVIII